MHAGSAMEGSAMSCMHHQFTKTAPLDMSGDPAVVVGRYSGALRILIIFGGNCLLWGSLALVMFR